MQKYEQLLNRLGMSEGERRIYLTLLEHPYLTITDIAKWTNYHRPMIYKIVRSLESEGYIDKSLLEGKRYFYHANSPSKLRAKLEELNSMADTIIPEMEELHGRRHDAPIISVREGVAGIQSIHADLVGTLGKHGLYYRYSSSKKEYEGRSLYVPDNYFDMQKKKELERIVITNEARRASRSDNPLRELLTIPTAFDPFDDNITKLIYKDKVAFIDYDAQMGWIIESERFARYEEKIFRLLAKLLRSTKRKA